MAVSEHLLATLLDAVQEGVYHTDGDRRIVHWNITSCRITGHQKDVVVGQFCQDRIVRHLDLSGKELCATDRCPLLVPLRTGKLHEDTLYLHHSDGHLVPVHVRTLPYFEPGGRVGGVSQYYQVTRDADHRKAQEWKQAALTDALTGVGNRRRFASAWASLRRKKMGGAGVLLIDIDRFKLVNDTHGHGVGDRVLKMVAKTLGASMRQGDAVVRWGGEEFVILVSPTTLEQLTDLAERLRQLVSRSWVVLPEGGHLSVTVSIGAALVRPGEKSPEALARADARLLTCKAQGRNQVLVGD